MHVSLSLYIYIYTHAEVSVGYLDEVMLMLASLNGDGGDSNSNDTSN